MTVFVVVVAVALVAAAGLVVDGGYTLAAERRAYNEAEAAARAGAQALSADTSRNGGTLVLDPGAATAAAQTYLAQTGHVGTVVVTGDSVAVDVSFVEPMRMLNMFGVSQLQVHGHGQATAVAGIQTVGG